MANEKNLKSAAKRSPSEARENGKKGGIASGKARRQKKALRFALKEAVMMTLGDLPPDLRNGIMKAAKVKDRGLLVSDAILGSIVRAACGGNSQMMKLLLDTIGESADVRIKERELKLKEKAVDTLKDQVDKNLFADLTTDELRKLIDGG